MVSRIDVESILIRPGNDIEPEMTLADLDQIDESPLVRGLHHYYLPRAV